MTSPEFLAQLRALLGGRVEGEEMILGSSPRIYTHCRGHFVKVDFVSESELLLEVNTRPPQPLRLRREGFVLGALAAIGILSDRKTGNEVFDGKYLIDYASQEWAAAALTGEVRELISNLEPFALFELTHKEYRCFKSVDLDDYTPARAARDVEALLRITEITRGLDPQAKSH